MRAPFVWSGGSVTVRPLILVSLEADDGAVGHGEAAPLAGYDGVTVDDVRSVLEQCRPLLEATPGLDPQQIVRASEPATVLPSACAALDLAIWDLVGRRAGVPAWQLLGAGAAPPVPVNATITATDRAGAAREAAAAVARGFRCVKMKVGIGDDAGRLAAIRAAAGPELAIRLDANGAWSKPEAVAALDALAPVGLELCEEPVSDVWTIGRLARETQVPLSIDESATTQLAVGHRWCDAICLKLTRFGGLSGLMVAARHARATGYRVYLSSTLDGPLGIAATLHAAAAIAPDLPCGLATLGHFADREDPLEASGGTIAVPSGPGLGDGLLSWYR